MYYNNTVSWENTCITIVWLVKIQQHARGHLQACMTRGLESYGIYTTPFLLTGSRGYKEYFSFSACIMLFIFCRVLDRWRCCCCKGCTASWNLEYRISDVWHRVVVVVLMVQLVCSCRLLDICIGSCGLVWCSCVCPIRWVQYVWST
jgi:hypothetical protein